MISAVDSSVILDVVTDDPSFADASEALLRRVSREGKLVIGECVLAEIRPAFDSTASLDEFLSDWQLVFTPSSQESATRAGELFARYLQRGGTGGRIVPDFLIGAHALLHADRLVARDRGYLRDYFSALTLLDPSS
jgi:predicted nucleic acid-binding protein